MYVLDCDVSFTPSISFHPHDTILIDIVGSGFGHLFTNGGTPCDGAAWSIPGLWIGEVVGGVGRDIIIAVLGSGLVLQSSGGA